MHTSSRFALAKSSCAVLLLLCATSSAEAVGPGIPDYNRDVVPILRTYCVGCHNADEKEGELNLATFSELMKGGEEGAVVVASKSGKSRLVLMLEGKVEPLMPPEDEEAPSKDEIALLKRWIDAGAVGPKTDDVPTLVTPVIKPKDNVTSPVGALAWAPRGALVALARYRTVEIHDVRSGKTVATLTGHAGHVNDVGFTRDGKLLYAAAGEPSLAGEVRLWSTEDWRSAGAIRGHSDSLYAAAVSPDGKTLVTGGYDQTIKVWDISGPQTDSGSKSRELRTLKGHNGAVYGLAFHPAGKIFASASADRTVKLWDAATGKRLDTFSQPTKGQNVVAFHPDGSRLVAGGIDNRIRVWEMRQGGREGTSPQIYSQFAHEGPILALAFSPDGRALVSSGEDKSVKLWDAESMTLRRELEPQPDWPSALGIAADNRTLLVARMDGTHTRYPITTAPAGAGNAVASLRGVPLPAASTQASAELARAKEVEPNDVPGQATSLTIPAVVDGVLGEPQDVDLFAFEAKRGQSWVIETNAAQQKSPADTKIEVLHADGKPVLRLLLRAVRDSAINFRPIDSSGDQVRIDHWEEMELNQFLYMSGEVGKFFRMPRGPDSGMQFYKSSGKRRCYFDTSATGHAIDDVVYIVDPYPPGTELADNGLPVFNLYFANDDDGQRKLGKDSRLMFTAPEEGRYLVRVSDVREFGGSDYKYGLTIRPANPGFTAASPQNKKTIAAGSGQRFVVSVERKDDFEGPVRIDIEGIPAGFHIPTPIVIEARHTEARGVINVDADAKTPAKEVWSQVKVTATALIHGQEIRQELGHLGELVVGAKPKVLVTLSRDAGSGPGSENELVVAPGTSITAMLRVERNGYDGDLKFDLDNLPHGVIVDNIGLSGVLVRAGETERQIFITAADWVPATTRPVHAVSAQEGAQASRPILLRVPAAAGTVSGR